METSGGQMAGVETSGGQMPGALGDRSLHSPGMAGNSGLHPAPQASPQFLRKAMEFYPTLYPSVEPVAVEVRSWS